MATNLPPIKASDCYFAADVEIADPSSPEAKSAPISIKARSGDAINHHVWGRVVHDFDGMQHKPRIALDYNHDPNEVVGYANKFNTESGDLDLKGALTPFKQSDRATEILTKSKMNSEDGGGVPYEASINFAGDMQVERLEAGESDTINGREFSGPLTVIRKWHLRGVAITPYGYDSNTSSTALADDGREIKVTSIQKDDTEMATDTNATVENENKTEAVEAQAVDTATDLNSPEAGATTAPAVDGQPTEATNLADKPAQEYFDAFGEQQGAVYFARGVPFMSAMVTHVKAQDVKIAELAKRVDSQATEGADDAVNFSHGDITNEEGKDGEGRLTALPIKIA